MDEYKVATGLGWFSIGLGLAEVLAPEQLGKVLGLENRTGLIRFYGLREIAAGVGILSQSHPTAGWLWARVAGDALDLATLGSTYEQNPTKRTAIGVAIGSVLAVTVLDVICAQRLSK